MPRSFLDLADDILAERQKRPKSFLDLADDILAEQQAAPVVAPTAPVVGQMFDLGKPPAWEEGPRFTEPEPSPFAVSDIQSSPMVPRVAYAEDAIAAPPAPSGPSFMERYAEEARRQGLPPSAPGSLQPPPEPIAGFERGFAQGLYQDNAQATGSAMEAIGYLTGSDRLKGLGKRLQTAEVRESLKVRDQSWGKAFDHFETAVGKVGEEVGRNLGGFAPLVAFGAGGMAAAGPAGMTAGTFFPAYVLSLGATYDALKQEGTSPEQAAKIAAPVAALMATVQVWGTKSMADMLATPDIQREVLHSLARRLATSAGRGAATLGSMSGLVSLIEQAALEQTNPKAVPLSERLKAVGASAVGGGLLGAGLGVTAREVAYSRLPGYDAESQARYQQEVARRSRAAAERQLPPGPESAPTEPTAPSARPITVPPEAQFLDLEAIRTEAQRQGISQVQTENLVQAAGKGPAEYQRIAAALEAHASFAAQQAQEQQGVAVPAPKVGAAPTTATTPASTTVPGLTDEMRQSLLQDERVQAAVRQPVTLAQILTDIGGIRWSDEVAGQYQALDPKARGSLSRAGVVRAKGTPAEDVVRSLVQTYPEAGIQTEADLFAAVQDKEKLKAPYERRAVAVAPEAQGRGAVLDLRDAARKAKTTDDLDAVRLELARLIDTGQIAPAMTEQIVEPAVEQARVRIEAARPAATSKAIPGVTDKPPQPETLETIIRAEGGIHWTPTYAPDYKDRVERNVRVAHRKSKVVVLEGGTPSDALVEMLDTSYPSLGIRTEDDLIDALRDPEKLRTPVSGPTEKQMALEEQRAATAARPPAEELTGSLVRAKTFDELDEAWTQVEDFRAKGLVPDDEWRALEQTRDRHMDRVMPTAAPEPPARPTPEPTAKEPFAATKRITEALRVGDEESLMSVPSVLAQTAEVGGTRLELFNGARLAEKRATVRVYDTDSGEVLEIRQHPTYDSAETAYRDLVAKAQAMERPAAPEAPEPPAPAVEAAAPTKSTKPKTAEDAAALTVERMTRAGVPGIARLKELQRRVFGVNADKDILRRNMLASTGIPNLREMDEVDRTRHELYLVNLANGTIPMQSEQALDVKIPMKYATEAEKQRMRALGIQEDSSGEAVYVEPAASTETAQGRRELWQMKSEEYRQVRAAVSGRAPRTWQADYGNIMRRAVEAGHEVPAEGLEAARKIGLVVHERGDFAKEDEATFRLKSIPPNNDPQAVQAEAVRLRTDGGEVYAVVSRPFSTDPAGSRYWKFKVFSKPEGVSPEARRLQDALVEEDLQTRDREPAGRWVSAERRDVERLFGTLPLGRQEQGAASPVAPEPSPAVGTQQRPAEAATEGTAAQGEPAKGEALAAGREPWEMTRDEVGTRWPNPEGDEGSRQPWMMPAGEWAAWEAAVFGDKAKPPSDRQREWHKGQVLAALAAGKPVPTEVLADYPDLQRAAVRQEAPPVVDERPAVAAEPTGGAEPGMHVLTTAEVQHSAEQSQIGLTEAQFQAVPIPENYGINSGAHEAYVWGYWQALEGVIELPEPPIQGGSMVSAATRGFKAGREDLMRGAPQLPAPRPTLTLEPPPTRTSPTPPAPTGPFTEETMTLPGMPGPRIPTTKIAQGRPDKGLEGTPLAQAVEEQKKGEAAKGQTDLLAERPAAIASAGAVAQAPEVAPQAVPTVSVGSTSEARVAVALRRTADTLEQSANAKLSAGRQVNTPRRVRIASNVEGVARRDLAMAGTLRKVADALGAGEAPHLAGVRSRAQVELLDDLLRQGQYDRARAEKRDLEGVRDRPATEEDANRATFPRLEIHKSSLDDVLKAVQGKPGTAEAIKYLRRARGATSADNWLVYLPGKDEVDALETVLTKAKKLVATQSGLASPISRLSDELAKHRRFEKLGLDTREKFHAALREFVVLQGERQTEDPVKAAERALVGIPIPGYFPTPAPVVEQMLEQADIQPGQRVLEPSAGKGNIADAIRTAEPGVRVETIEPVQRLRAILEAKGHEVVGNDFLTHEGQYDRIVMNPPFENGQDIVHVQHAYEELKPGGRVVAIMSEGPFFRQDGKATAFRDWLESVGGTSEKLPPGAFQDSERPTGVATRLVVIDKPAVGEESPASTYPMSAQLQGPGVVREDHLPEGNAPPVVERLPDGALRLDMNRLTQGDLSKISTAMKRRGFDVRGADDARTLLESGRLGRGGRITHLEWVEGIAQALQLDVAPETKKLQQHARVAARTFGVTADPKEIGYILTNGSTLDFSGKRQGGGASTRALDHREIARAFEPRNSGYSTAMMEFIAEGNIRYLPEQGGFDFGVAPTKEQRRAVARLILHNHGAAWVDLFDGLGEYDPNRESYTAPDRNFNRQYPEGTTPARVLADIDAFYAGREPTPLRTAAFREEAQDYAATPEAQQSPDQYGTLPPVGEDAGGAAVDTGRPAQRPQPRVSGDAFLDTDAEVPDLSVVGSKRLPVTNDGIRTLASTLRADVAARGYLRPEGLVVGSYHELAKIAQVMRDPGMEHYRLVVVGKDSRKILAHEDWTSKLPDAAMDPLGEWFSQKRYDQLKKDFGQKSADLYRVATWNRAHVGLHDRIQRTRRGAGEDVEVYILHNHPSGDSTPSGIGAQVPLHSGDMGTTESMKHALSKFPGVRFAGHVIINSGEYSVIEPDGTWGTYDLERGQALPSGGPAEDQRRMWFREQQRAQDPLRQNVTTLELELWIDKKSMDRQSIAQMGVALKQSPKHVSLFGFDSHGRLVAVQQVPVGFFNRTDQFAGYLNNLARTWGAHEIAAYYEGDPTTVLPAGQALVKQHDLTDLVLLDHKDRVAVEQGGGDLTKRTANVAAFEQMHEPSFQPGRGRRDVEGTVRLREEGEPYPAGVPVERAATVREATEEPESEPPPESVAQVRAAAHAVNPGVVVDMSPTRDGRLPMEKFEAQAKAANAEAWDQAVAEIVKQQGMSEKEVRRSLGRNRKALLKKIGQWREAGDYVPPGYLVHTGSDGKKYASEPLVIPPETWTQHFNRKVQDSFNRLAQVQGLGRTFTDAHDAYLEHDLGASAAGEAVRVFRERVEDPNNPQSLVRRVVAAGRELGAENPLDAFGDYLTARHQPERDATIAERDPEAAAFGKGIGMDPEEATALRQQYDGTLFQALADEFYETVTKPALKLARDARLIGQDEYDELSGRWQYYVPAKGHEDPAESQPARTGRRFLGKQFKVARGRSSAAFNPFAQALADHEETIRRAKTNEERRAFLRFAQDNPSPSWEVEKIRAVPTFYQTGKFAGGRANIQYRDNELDVRDGEHAYVVRITDPALVEGLKQLKVKHIGNDLVFRFLTGFTRYARAVAIRFSPEFTLITNPERDVQTAVANITAEQSAKLAGHVVVNAPAAALAIRRVLRGLPNEEWGEGEKAFDEYRQTGGLMHWSMNEDGLAKLERLSDMLNRSLQRNSAAEFGRGIIEYWDQVNQMVENALRLSYYQSLRQGGQTAKRAAQGAKNLTVNFEKHGDYGPVINGLWMFANAGIQSNARFWRVVASPEPRTRHRAWVLIGGLAGLGFATAVWNRMAWDDKEKDEKGLKPSDDWGDMNDSLKDGFWLVRNPSKVGSRYISVRTGWGWNVPVVLGTAAEELVYGDHDPGRFLRRIVTSLVDAFNPLGGNTLSQFLLPTFADLVAAIIENKDPFGTPIVKEKIGNEGKPNSQMYFKSVRPYTQQFAAWMNKAGGGNERLSGRVDLPLGMHLSTDVNPEWMDYLIDQLGGGAFKFLANAGATAETLAKDGKADLRNIPFLRQFGKNPSGWVPRTLAKDLLDDAGHHLMEPSDQSRFAAALNRAVLRGAMEQEETKRLWTEFQNAQSKLRASQNPSGYDPQMSVEDRYHEVIRLQGAAAAKDYMGDIGQADALRQRAERLMAPYGGEDGFKDQLTTKQRHDWDSQVKSHKTTRLKMLEQ